MITAHLLSFTIVVLSQLLLFIIHAWSVGELRKVPKYSLQGALVGLPFGISCDLLLGHQLGFWTYELGFVWWFLVINGIFSYGLMIGNVILLYKHSFLNMLSWVLVVASSYELVNYYFPVWIWTYMPYGLPMFIVLFLLYLAFTWGIMVSLRIAFRMRFRLVPF